MKIEEKEQKIKAIAEYICRHREGTSDSDFIRDNNMEARIEAVKRGEVYDAKGK